MPAVSRPEARHAGGGGPGPTPLPTQRPDQAAPAAAALVGSSAPHTASHSLPVGLARLLPYAAGNRAVELVVQRGSRADALAWLRALLADRATLTTGRMDRAATRLGGWSFDRQAHLIHQVRAAVDGFEVAAGAAGLLTHPSTARVLAILEGAQDTAALAARLVTLFQASVQPLMGLVIAAELPADRLRAAIETHAGAAAAITTLLTRNPVAATPGHLLPARGQLDAIRAARVNPAAAGVTASSPAREAAVEAILTPPAVANARAAAAAAGAPPPAFIPANYYQDVVVALHQSMLEDWAWAAPMDARGSLDTTAGGHVEGIAAEAKARVDALFGAYGSAAAPALTFGAATLEDRGTIAGDPADLTRWYLNEGSDRPAMALVKETHHAFEDAAAAQVIEADVIAHYSGRTAPAAAPHVAAIAALGMPTAERIRRLTVIDRMWPGAAFRGVVSVAARQGATPRETRGIYWGLFKTMIHEYLHTTEHATYQAWYGALRDSHHVTTYQEGVTDLFTLKSWRSVFPEEIANNRAFRRRIQGNADPDRDMSAAGGEPGHYAELAEAQQLEAQIGEANLKAAYFRGNTAVLGGGRLPR